MSTLNATTVAMVTARVAMETPRETVQVGYLRVVVKVFVIQRSRVVRDVTTSFVHRYLTFIRPGQVVVSRSDKS